jgi:hypothetical protein
MAAEMEEDAITPLQVPRECAQLFADDFSRRHHPGVGARPVHERADRLFREAIPTHQTLPHALHIVPAPAQLVVWVVIVVDPHQERSLLPHGTELTRSPLPDLHKVADQTSYSNPPTLQSGIQAQALASPPNYHDSRAWSDTPLHMD